MENKKTLPVFSFGENGDNKWYSHADGKRIPCDEKTINILWWQWVMADSATRADDEKYIIFKVTKKGLSLNIIPPDES